MGRPSGFTQEIADMICERLAEGESLRKICLDKEAPCMSMVFRWLSHEDKRQFREQYTRAREIQNESLADELFDIADDGSNDWMERHDKDGNFIGWRENGEAMGRSKLRVDTRKWFLSKVQPKKYGDRIEHDVSDDLRRLIING